MKEDNKSLVKPLGLIFLAVILSRKLPHKSYSIIQYIIRPIRIKNSTIYLSGLIPLILLIKATKEMGSLERFKHRSKLFIFIFIVGITGLLMNRLLDVGRTTYHWLGRDGFLAIELEDEGISSSRINDDMKIHVALELKDYGKKPKAFKIRIHTPKLAEESLGQAYYESNTEYRTYGNRQVLKINEEIPIKLKKGQLQGGRDYEFYERFRQSIEYELYNEEESLHFSTRGDLH